MKRSSSSIALISALTLLISMPQAFALWGKATTQTSDGNAKMDLPEYNGLKHAVGVKDFDNQAGWHGRWELGSNLSIMLESALYDTGRFVLVERDQLKDVIAEQDLVASGRTAKASNVAKTGMIRPAKYLATGSVTEVSDNQSGGDAGINTRFGRIGLGKSDTQITIIVKLIDTTTSEIVAKQTIVGKAGKTGLKLSNLHVPGHSGSVDLGGFKKTPIGQAAQDCIVKASEFIAKEMEEFPFEGSVVTVSGKRIIINRGSEFGVEAGQALVLKEKGELLLDPETGAVLDRMEGEVTGHIKVDTVKEKIAYCSLVDGEMPQRGDAVSAE